MRWLNKQSFSGIFTLVGTMVGAGILGLPFVFSKAGFFIGIFWIVFLGSLMVFVHLCLGEIILRTKEHHQLVGYAEKYIGKKGKIIMVTAMTFGIYAALLAYLIGEGRSISYLVLGDFKYSIFFGCFFWIMISCLLREGFRELKKVVSFVVPALILLILFLFFYYIPKMQFSNLASYNLDFSFLPFGVVLFSMLGFSAIAEVERIMAWQKGNLKKVIIIGTLIPIVIYIIFCTLFVGVFGSSVEQVAPLSLGRIGSLIGICTMLTAYFVLSFALKDMFESDLKIKKSTSFFLVTLIPLVFYLVVYMFKLLDFVSVLGIGGVISGGLTGILIVLINYKSKIYGDKKPEYWMPMGKIIILLIWLIFLAGIVVKFLI